jgi:uncharacterized Zn finger protein
MTAKRKTRFNIDALRELAGDKGFARGEAYHRDGQVQILAIDSDCGLAKGYSLIAVIEIPRLPRGPGLAP